MAKKNVKVSKYSAEDVEDIRDNFKATEIILNGLDNGIVSELELIRVHMLTADMYKIYAQSIADLLLSHGNLKFAGTSVLDFLLHVTLQSIKALATIHQESNRFLETTDDKFVKRMLQDNVDGLESTYELKDIIIGWSQSLELDEIKQRELYQKFRDDKNPDDISNEEWFQFADNIENLQHDRGMKANEDSFSVYLDEYLLATLRPLKLILDLKNKPSFSLEDVSLIDKIKSAENKRNKE